MSNCYSSKYVKMDFSCKLLSLLLGQFELPYVVQLHCSIQKDRCMVTIMEYNATRNLQFMHVILERLLLKLYKDMLNIYPF